ncbi:MAG TPA: antibiotic biosynthesis monooxygenase, partial [Fibrobacteraceae bacterium]|nr:antibiotic biosynthesis monooxygenase [Fibrobacteraceae bacterium]
LQAFQDACAVNHQASIQEDGNLRFDVLQSEEDPCFFVLYEAYRSKVHAAAHKETPHYRVWRDSVAEMMAEPRKGIPYTGLWPKG